MINPAERLQVEAPIQGWKGIADFVGASEPAVWRWARRRRDPLPAWHYMHTVVAWPSALREWQARQLIPVSTSHRLQPVKPDGESSDDSG